jgi:hypothetical protein
VEVQVIRRVSVTVAALALVAIGHQPAAAATPLLPDLGMARLGDLTVTKTVDGRQQLRFSATVVNVGAGPFLVTASRPDTSSPFAGSQRIVNSDQSSSDTPVAVSFAYAGHSHTHWHVKDLETYTVERLDTGAPAGISAKSGFCFLDTTAYRLALPGAPQQAQYTDEGCGDQSSTTLSMGLSVGWGDKYGWTLSDQYVDITGLAVGKYRLRAVADADARFVESSRANNTTWIDFTLSERRGGLLVRVLGYGPVA